MAFFSMGGQMCRNRNDEMNTKVIVVVLAIPRASGASSGRLTNLSPQSMDRARPPIHVFEHLSLRLRSSLHGLLTIDLYRCIVRTCRRCRWRRRVRRVAIEFQWDVIRTGDQRPLAGSHQTGWLGRIKSSRRTRRT